MQRIKVYTLFDITETGAVRSFKPDVIPFTTNKNITVNNNEEYSFIRKQQSNFEVLLQVMSLRTQLHNINSFTNVYTDLKNYKFDKKYKGMHNLWKLTVEVENINPLSNRLGDLGHLYQDCNNVPMLVGLNETIKDNYIDCINFNTYFKLD